VARAESHIVDAVLEVAKERRQLLAKIKEAVERHDLDATFRYAQILIGRSENSESKTQ
jgi:hypothetical protein